jgi:hypothetical protein
VGECVSHRSRNKNKKTTGTAAPTPVPVVASPPQTPPPQHQLVHLPKVDDQPVPPPNPSAFALTAPQDFGRTSESVASLQVSVKKLEEEVLRLRNLCDDLNTFKHRVGELETKHVDLKQTVDEHKTLVAKITGAVVILGLIIGAIMGVVKLINR